MSNQPVTNGNVTARTHDYQAGRRDERQHILHSLQTFFNLTQLPDDNGVIDQNPEWDNGFQAAIALIRNGIK